MPRLEILNGKREGDVIQLTTDELIVGNKKSAGISIRDPWISFKHAKVAYEAGRYWIEDNNSTNGTWINGKRIKRQMLEEGDTVYFGKTKAKYVSESEGGAADTAELKALRSERDELLRIKDVLERFLDVSQSQRDEIVGKLKAPDPVVDSSAVEAERKRAKGLEQQIGELRGAKERIETELVEAKRAAEDARESLGKVETERDALQGKVGELESAAANAAGAADEERGKIQTLEARVAELESEKANVDRQLEEAQLEVKQKTEALAAAEQAASEGGGDSSHLEVEVKHLTEKLEQKEKALEEATANADKQRQELMTKNVELENKIGKLEREIEQSSAAGADVEDRVKAEVEKATDGLQKDVRAKVRALEDAQRAQKNAEDQVKELREQVEALKATPQQDGGASGEVERLQSELAEAQSKIEALSSGGGGGDDDPRVAALQAEIEGIRSERDEAQQEMQETREEIDELSQEQIKLEEEIERLEKENAELKAKG